MVKPGQHFEQSRLPCPVGPDHSMPLAVVDGESNPGKQRLGSELLREPLATE